MCFTKNLLYYRDDERQKVCLDIVYKMMAELKPVELRELLNPVVEFVSHPSPTCREQMYNILMWIHDNYRLAFITFYITFKKIYILCACMCITNTCLCTHRDQRTVSGFGPPFPLDSDTVSLFCACYCVHPAKETLGLQKHYFPQVCIGAGDLNSVPYACTTIELPTDSTISPDLY